VKSILEHNNFYFKQTKNTKINSMQVGYAMQVGCKSWLGYAFPLVNSTVICYSSIMWMKMFEFQKKT
jgi:hypothetical protein